ncbi:MAG: clostripain-related cysteine peptidase [Phycisphaerales bacterium]
MTVRSVLAIVWLTSMNLGLAAAAAQEPAPQEPPVAKAADPNDKVKDKDKDQVKIKEELQLLGKVFQRRLLLHYLKDEESARTSVVDALASESGAAAKRLIEDDASFKRLDYHLAEKAKNCERRLLAQLRKNKFQGVEDVLEFVADRKYPDNAAYAPLMGMVDMNFRYARRKELIGKDDFAKDLSERLMAATAAVQGTAGHSISELAKVVWKDKKPSEIPAWWFDPASGPIVFEFMAVPPAPEYPMVDLNQAGVDELLTLPSMDQETAEAIRKYAEKNGFQGPEELRLIREVPRHLLEPLQTLCTAGHTPKQKKWTVMVFLNAANNLEAAGIDDLNEMEKIGSTREVNVVVELARYHSTLKSPPVSDEYFANPLAEHHPVFYYGLENGPGICRYYVLQDDDDVLVRSVLKDRSSQTDAGRPESLVEFAKWAIERYPAERYALVIWNHGAGWAGVSYDDNTEHRMDLPDLRTAMEQICASLGEGRHIDVLDFDACLMATLEVGYELKDTVDYLVASQEVEPDDGMPYDDYLKWLTMYPSAPADCFAKAMVDSYVRSYAPKGSQVDGDDSSFSETKSAIRLSRMEDLRTAVHHVAELLLARPALMGEVTEQLMCDVRRFGRLVDIDDFFTKLAEREKKDEELKTAIQAVLDLIGYPQDRYKLVNEVVITRRSAGSVIWGFNGWLCPPNSLAPYVHEGRYAKTPLAGPDERGNYVARIEFPAMLTDPNTDKQVQVTEINYRFDDEQTKRTAKDFKNQFIATDFPEDGVVLAEGHMVSNCRSHGLSIYFPAYLGFDPEYGRLRFSQDSPWAQLCAKFPFKAVESPEPVLLAGLGHLTRAERERLGAIVTPEEFRRAVCKLDTTTPWAEPLKTLGCTFTVAPDPRPYGRDWAGLIAQWNPKLVLVDNTSGTPSGGGDPYAYLSERRPRLPTLQGPDTRTLSDYLGKGGRLLLTTPDVLGRSWDLPLYRDVLGLTYGQRWDRSYKFHLADREEPVFEIETQRKGQAIRTFTGGDGVSPLCVLADSQATIGAKIERNHPTTGAPFRAAVLGFYLADVKDASQRQALLKEILAFLYPEGVKQQ